MKLDGRQVIAFASHALVPGDLDGLTEFALALSPTQKEKPSADEDGLLTMREIMALQLNADMVILSACNTAATDGSGEVDWSGRMEGYNKAGPVWSH